MDSCIWKVQRYWNSGVAKRRRSGIVVHKQAVVLAKVVHTEHTDSIRSAKGGICGCKKRYT